MLVLLADLIAELVKPAEMVFRNDANIRRLEGLPLEVTTRSGQPWEPRWVAIDGFDYWLDLQGGQKTGFYLDQREQHSRVASYASGRRVLDAFCNQGSFAMHCARAGAASVRGLDSAFDAIGQAKKNAERNGVKAEFVAANVFDWFTAQRDAEPGLGFDCVGSAAFRKIKVGVGRSVAWVQRIESASHEIAHSGWGAGDVCVLASHAGQGTAFGAGGSRCRRKTSRTRTRIRSSAAGSSSVGDYARERVFAGLHPARGVK